MSQRAGEECIIRVMDQYQLLGGAPASPPPAPAPLLWDARDFSTYLQLPASQRFSP